MKKVAGCLKRDTLSVKNERLDSELVNIEFTSYLDQLNDFYVNFSIPKMIVKGQNSVFEIEDLETIKTEIAVLCRCICCVFYSDTIFKNVLSLL